MANSRAKGARFERQVAARLREWLGEDWDVSRIRTDQQQGTEHAGEYAITGGPFRFPFALELKAHNTFGAHELWSEPVSKQVRDWWAQAVRQAEGASLLPVLLIWRPRRSTLCVMRRATASVLGLTQRAPSMRLWLDDGTHGGDALLVVPFERMLAVDPSWLKEVAQ